MAGFYPGESSHHGAVRSGSYNNSYDRWEEPDRSGFGSGWYFSRKEIEENSPSRRDGIDLKKETYLRKSYCTFLQDLGMRLKVPQVTIATAIVFSHRFFLRQSHAKNDRRTIATVCMFLAGKVEETPRPLKDVILVSYEIIHKKDPSAVQRIKQKEVYEQQKELILLGERVVLATLGFDLNVHHPYKPLVEAIKRFRVAQNALAQVAWNFVNDGLRTSLCLQFMPHHIAAGAIFLAAKFLKVKLPSDGEKVWWQEFDVTPRQLEDVSNQMLELYEQNRAGQPSHANEVEGSTGGGTNQPAPTASTVSESSISVTGPAQDAGGVNFKQGGQAPPPARPVGSQSHANNYRTGFQSMQKVNDNWSADSKSMILDQNMDTEGKDFSHHEVEKFSGCRESTAEVSSYHGPTFDRPDAVVGEKGKTMEMKERRDESSFAMSSSTSGWNSKYNETARGYCPPDAAITKIDKDKVKAALEKRRKLRNDVAKKTDIIDEDDLIERELENGIELVVEDGKIKQERRPAWPRPLNKKEPDNECSEQVGGSKDVRNFKAFEQQASQDSSKFRSISEDKTKAAHSFESDQANAEEGELSSLDEHEILSPKVCISNGKVTNTRYPSREVSGTGRLESVKRNRDNYEDPSPKLVSEKAMGMGRHSESMQHYENSHSSRDATGTGWTEFTERDYKRFRY